MVTSRCSDCHALDEGATSSPDLALPAGHQYCYVCHGTEPVASASTEVPSRNQCGACHRFQASPEGSPAHGLVADFLHWDHRLDIRRRRVGGPVARGDELCILCHGSVSASTSLAAIEKPASANCGECHTGWLGFPDPLDSEIEDRLRAE